MTLKGGTSQACAACKYQRRKCTPECQLAPYFPADKPEVFKNAHKLFGVKNILNILKTLQDPAQKVEAMTSIICQANIREMFPVHGCCQVIDLYCSQIRLLEEELHATYSQLEFYRSQQHNQAPTSVPSQLELGMAPPNNANALQLYQPTASTQPPYNNALPLAALPPQSYSNGTIIPTNNDSSPSSYLDSKEGTPNPSLWIQSSYTNTNSGNNNSRSCPTIQPQLVGPIAASQTSLAVQGIIQDYEDMHPFFESIDDRQSYIGSKDACESSSESSLKDMTQSKEHVAENELKSAAACFSLTSVN
ncbi:LOB domain-containing protein 27-like [Punica granatum]|uniref:LOB domain-containing protein 27-like n=2 Tax=Punica granatum TaxID=22663 RepID=A0A6P8EL10_PUNGR|nr:LOB domain-containing protein 27-like [Punica granatum]PKI63191.1 hypothetical protein CRG98_016376 [Punica granatum]